LEERKKERKKEEKKERKLCILHFCSKDYEAFTSAKALPLEERKKERRKERKKERKNEREKAVSFFIFVVRTKKPSHLQRHYPWKKERRKKRKKGRKKEGKKESCVILHFCCKD
jgi:hypothetical protein